ncbi:MAG: rRNA maturation RNase YbeY [Gracilibacteraceae bacterium]|jgi:probable rRNA maturation factor|nr:rRNA maturation RNase YbeY [Gracilibacteraceae bacterium]
MEIDVIWEAEETPEREALTAALQAGVAEALRRGGGPPDAEVCVLVTDDARLRELNRVYRGVDRVTDVLSFSLRETGAGEPAIADADEDDPALGDVVISARRAAAQAAEYGHSLRREMVFLAVHGTLHLLGYDHGAAEDAAAMRALEKMVMEKAGFAEEKP